MAQPLETAEALVVDDDGEVCRCLGALVAGLGAKAHLAATPDEASRIAAARPLDVAFVDLRFPGGDLGFDLCRSLNGLRRPVPCVIITGDDGPETRRKAFACGAAGFHAKPLQAASLEQDLAIAARVRSGPSPLFGGSAGRSWGRLLLVDNDEGWLRGAATALAAAGFEVQAAPTGRQGLFLAARTEFDAVLLEGRLSGLSGSEIAPAFKAMRASRPPVVLLWTGAPDAGEEGRCLESGVDDYVAKNASAMTAMIRRVQRRLGLSLFGTRLALDERRREARTFAGERHGLNEHAFAFLTLLGGAKGDVVSREAVIRHVYGDDAGTSSQLRLNEMVKRLRERLPADWARALQTVYRTGYALRP